MMLTCVGISDGDGAIAANIMEKKGGYGSSHFTDWFKNGFVSIIITVSPFFRPSLLYASIQPSIHLSNQQPN